MFNGDAPNNEITTSHMTLIHEVIFHRDAWDFYVVPGV